MRHLATNHRRVGDATTAAKIAFENSVRDGARPRYGNGALSIAETATLRTRDLEDNPTIYDELGWGE